MARANNSHVNFSLFIYDNAEIVHTCAPGAGGREVPLLGVTSAFIKALCPLAIQAQERMLGAAEVYRAMLQVYGALSRDADGVKQRIALLDAEASPFVLYDWYYYPPTAAFAPESIVEQDRLERVVHRRAKHPQGPWLEPPFWFLLEGLALRRAVKEWLTPRWKPAWRRYLTPTESFVHVSERRAASRPPLDKGGDEFSSFLRDTAFLATFPSLAQDYEKFYLNLAFRKRTCETGTALQAKMKGGRLVPTHFFYSTHGLLPLAWAEIMWAIDRGLYAHTCDVCGGVFALHPPYKRAAYICSPECARKRKIERMGGLDAARAYNREAQKKYREKMRARKERTQNAEEES